jgi:serine/threonine protein kinase
VTNQDEELLAELLLRWEELHERGQDTPASELAKNRLDLVEELDRRIRVLKDTAWLDNPIEDDPEADDPRPISPHSPRTLSGRYRLDELIAQGGFAEVYRAYDTELQRTVAVKMPKPGRLESTESFQAEARRVARLKHENIVPVFDVGLEDDTCFIVTEYIEGGSLVDRIVSRLVAPEQAVGWACDIADALEYAHLNGVIHLDIKPANILIGANGRAKLADFGIAKSATKTGEFAPSLGTLRYMSPEQLEGRPTDHRSDIYSLAVVLHETLTGSLPYSSAESNVLRKEIVEGTALPSKEVPRELGQVLTKAMARSPHERHASATQFASEIRRAGVSRTPSSRWPLFGIHHGTACGAKEK